VRACSINAPSLAAAVPFGPIFTLEHGPFAALRGDYTRKYFQTMTGVENFSCSPTATPFPCAQPEFSVSLFSRSLFLDRAL
jgi:hypothetical protein